MTARRIPIRRVITSLIFLIIGIAIWRIYFTPPAESETKLFRGVTYNRRVLRSPHLATIHQLTIQTDTPGLRFFITPPDSPSADLPLRARTVSEFFHKYHVQVATNADFYSPWHSTTPWDYYPHHHDPVRVEGDAVTEGKRYSFRQKTRQPRETLYLSRDNRPSLDPPRNGAIWNAVGGHPLLRNGVFPLKDPYSLQQPDPRTALGWSPDGKTLYWVIVDGRQMGYSEGITLRELADYFRSLGVRDAINLDGGGSSVMIVDDGHGGSRTLSRPIDQHIPGKERYVANQLGLYAPPL